MTTTSLPVFEQKPSSLAISEEARIKSEGLMLANGSDVMGPKNSVNSSHSAAPIDPPSSTTPTARGDSVIGLKTSDSSSIGSDFALVAVTFRAVFLGASI